MVLPKPILTEEEYLKFERSSNERHIFVDGEIFAMAGESPDHGNIAANMVISIGNQLGHGPCRVRFANTEIRSGPMPKSPKRPGGLFSYPNIVVICEEPKYLDEYQDVVINSTAVFEILSESTEAFDRGTKFHRYQRDNPTLTDYVLVSQDQPMIEHYHREKDGKWTYEILEGLKATLNLPSIRCQLNDSEVYHRVHIKDLDES